MSRVLHAWFNHIHVGVLREAQGLWGFQYSTQWLETPHAFSLCPKLLLRSEAYLDGASQRPVQWYFDNLLPEENQRTLMAKDAQLDDADALGLLAHYGAECAGSLSLLPQGMQPETEGGLHALSDAVLDARIRQLPKSALTHAAVKRMSLAGAQHKLGVVFKHGQLFEPQGNIPSTHILKPNHSDEDYPHSAINEWFTMRLAKQLGLEVPHVFRNYVPSPVYIIERFDRLEKQSVHERLHAIDACQLLGVDRSFKYSAGSVDALLAIANACRSPVATKMKLFAWLVFNVLIGNSDAHLKNLSFMVSSDGIMLAPFYDMLSIATYDTLAFNRNGWPSQTQLAWPLMGAKYFSDINRATLLKAAQHLNVSATTAERQIETLRMHIFEKAEHVYAEFESENHQWLDLKPELAAVFAGEARCLRAILYNVIKPMVRQLG